MSPPAGVFEVAKPVVGVIHAPPLPGAPANELPFPEIRRRVLRDAESLAAGGVDGYLVENFGDAPFYPGRVPAHTLAYLSVLVSEVIDAGHRPAGVNVLRNDGVAALSVAAASGADFIRVNVHTGVRVADSGLLRGRAHRVLRLRRLLGADVRVFADVDVKHSRALGGRPLRDEVRAAVERGRADALIVTGTATGEPADPAEVEEAKAAAGEVPVLVGSGVTPESVGGVLAVADGVLVGTALKRDGEVSNPVDADRVARFMEAARSARGG